MCEIREGLCSDETNAATVPGKEQLLQNRRNSSVARCVETVASAAKAALVRRQSTSTTRIHGAAQRTKSDPVGMPTSTARNMLHYPSGDLRNCEEAQEASLLTATAHQEEDASKLTTSRDLQTLTALLSSTLSGMDCTLRNQTLKPPKFSSRGAAIWRDTPLWPQQAAVCGGAAADGLYSLQACATVMHDGDSAWNKAKLMVGMPGAVGNIVCTMSGAGTQLRDGKVVLSSDDLRNSTSKPDVALVLNGSCSAVAFRNMTFVGGQIVCYGKNCSATFAGVTLERCTLVVVAGACVTLDRTTFKDMECSRSGLSVLVHGSGSKVVSEGGCITGGTQGLAVQAGGWLEASDLTISHTAVTAAEVKDPASCMKLTNCTMHNFSQRFSYQKLSRAVHVHAGATCKLTAVTVSGGEWGVDIRTDTSKAVLQDCSVSDCACACVLVREGGAARMIGCKLARSKTRQGLYVVGSGTFAEASRCQFVGNARFGAAAIDGGWITAQGCESIRNKLSGFLSQGSGTVVELSGCTSEGDQKGCEVNRGGRLTAHKVWVACSTLSGFGIFSEGNVILRDCVAKECGLQGLYVRGVGSRADVARCQFVQNMYSGAVAFSGGQLTTDDVTKKEMHGSNRLAGNYSSGVSGGEAGGELVGLHVGCITGHACAICQASERGILTADDAGGDADVHVATHQSMGVHLQGLVQSNHEKPTMHGLINAGGEGDAWSSDDESD